MSHASTHVAIQQLALMSSSSLQSDDFRASDMNPEILGYKANESPWVQLRTNHGSAAHTVAKARFMRTHGAASAQQPTTSGGMHQPKAKDVVEHLAPPRKHSHRA